MKQLLMVQKIILIHCVVLILNVTVMSQNLTFVDDGASSEIIFTGTWSHISRPEAYGGTISVSGETNASAETNFTGSGLQVFTQMGVGAGIFDIYVDNQRVISFDSYNARQRNQVLAYENMSLINGNHNVRIVNTGSKNSSATGTNMHLDVIAYKPEPSAVKAQIVGDTSASSQSFALYLTFSDSVTGLSPADIITENGSIDSITGSGKYYSLHLKAAQPGNVTVSLPANVVSFMDGTAQNSASNNFTLPVRFDPMVTSWEVDSDLNWQASGMVQSGLTFVNGEAVPSGDSANYSSVMKVFTQTMKPESITIKQSAVWDNWTEVSNVGPSGAGDAPIFLPVANDDYYFLGLSGASNLYAAWHSTDMIHWTEYGPIASGNTLGDGHFRIGRWLTSAEYKDGMFYIIGDVPNDEDPHLWMDDDLKDNIPATYIDTAVFSDPSHGSDAALFRNDGDGNFHIIYEDWTPINASTHAWDSPLGGHTSSPDCINGFEPHKHRPIIDFRTTHSGEYRQYTHPGNLDPLTFEVREPEQDAFGDWTAIKVGSQFYLFADYDPVGQGMRTARFTSHSLYEEFKLVGTTGSGHPDPTVGFAEGQFYLITQQNTDQISPGPWVEMVEVRVGVDVSGNGIIDQWSSWQEVKESYDHKPGYARVVNVAPAKLDLASLPAGLGFKFEFRISDQTPNVSKPIIDKVIMDFIKDPNSSITEKFSKGNLSHIQLNQYGGEWVLSYLMKQPGEVKVKIIDVTGRVMEKLSNWHNLGGDFKVTLPSLQKSGLYFVEVSNLESAESLWMKFYIP